MFKRRNFLSRAALAGAALVAFAGAGAGCASRGQQPIGEYVDDAATTTRVKTRLIEDDIIRAFQIRVDTLAGVVRLTGAVRTQAQSQRAEELTRAAYGVKDVRNEIVISP